MTHLTADSTVIVRAQLSASDRAGRRRSSRRPVTGAPANPVFFSLMANFLELAAAAFHYSVTAGYATIAIAPGLAGCHRLIDDVTASDAQVNAAGARRREKRRFIKLGRSQLRHGGRKSDAKDCVLLTGCKSISRSRPE